MAFDERKFLKYYTESELTEEQKLERIAILKRILSHFVEGAHGQTPEQLCLGTSKEKYLQSHNVEVESKKLSKYFKNKSASKSKQKNILTKTNKENTHHADPR